MFCPKCRSEFIEGILECPDCAFGLIEQLPAEPAPAFVDYREVLTTFNPADIAFLKSYLDSEGIQYFFKGEHFMHARPLAEPVRLMIRTDQVDQARHLLKDVQLAYAGISLGNTH